MTGLDGAVDTITFRLMWAELERLSDPAVIGLLLHQLNVLQLLVVLNLESSSKG